MKTYVVYEIALCRVKNYVEAENEGEAKRISKEKYTNNVLWWEHYWVLLDEVIETKSIEEVSTCNGLPMELQDYY